MKKNAVIAASLAAGGFAAWRAYQRAELATRLERDPQLLALRAAWVSEKPKSLPPGMAWLFYGRFADKASDALPWFGLSTADDAFVAAMAEAKPYLTDERISKGVAVVEQALSQYGIQLPKRGKEALEELGRLAGKK